MTNRYYTPLRYKDGNGKEQHAQLNFELDPVELVDWVFENPFEANELQASLKELKDIEEEESRDLTEEEVRTMLGVVKLLSQISAGRPTEDGAYFLKDPNWTSSYAYRGFRTFLLTHPNEVTQFLSQLLDNDTMEVFVNALNESNEKMAAASTAATGTPDSGADVSAAMEAKIRAKIAAEQQLAAPPVVTE